MQNVDLVIALGDQASDLTTELAKNSEPKVFVISRKVPKYYYPESMTGVIVRNKISAAELNKTVATKIAQLIQGKQIKEIRATYF